MQTYLKLSYLGSSSALLAATCCVLPMLLMLLGIGGSGLAVFGLLAAASYPVLVLSTALLLVAGWLAHRRADRHRLADRAERKPDKRLPDYADVSR